jgi:hypothetical protein
MSFSAWFSDRFLPWLTSTGIDVGALLLVLVLIGAACWRTPQSRVDGFRLMVAQFLRTHLSNFWKAFGNECRSLAHDWITGFLIVAQGAAHADQ